MIKIENIETYGWEASLRGMRNPKNSWSRSDSSWEWAEDPSPINPDDPGLCYVLGENDLKLASTLADAGQVHGKFLRMIVVSMDITAPLYWWKEYDTYKVGTTMNGCSTMHKIHAKEFTREDFSADHLIPRMKEVLDVTIANLNACRGNYLKTQDKRWWWQMIQLLPSSYNQRRTVMLNYAVLKNIYEYRHNHKLDEWRTFCEVIEELPYAKELIIGNKIHMEEE